MTNEEQEMDEVVVVAQPLQHNIKNCVPPPLSTNTIISAIDAECTKSSSSALSLPQIRWRRHQYENHHQGQQDHPSSLLYTIVGELKEDDNTRTRTTVATTTFYFAYSTWDGRILYVDHIHLDDAIVIAEQQPTQLVYHILANIAIALHCCRLNWQHTKENAIAFQNTGTIQPQTLHGWLTLHWEKESIIQFLGGQRVMDTTIAAAVFSIDRSSSFRNIITSTLRQCNAIAAAAAVTTASSSSTEPSLIRSRRLRLASTNDVHTIGRLVQGLADFEKEPDAVNVTPDHYRMDGFQSNPPLFYCLLLEVPTITTTTVSDLNVVTNDDTDWYACGMAFCWIGSRQDVPNSNDKRTGTAIQEQQQESLFLYLEDLFIEETYRGNGAGTFVMTTLGEIALSLNCAKMVWQALDWNTLALTFYQNKIGAHIVDGLLTTRFAGSALHEFHILRL